MSKLNEMLKMNRKKNSDDTLQDKNKDQQIKDDAQTDKESQQPVEEQSSQEKEQNDKKEEPKELTLQQKFDEINDRFIRLHAEFDNFRKRTIKERIELCNTASEDVIKSMLPVIDDLERAIKSIKNSDELNTFNEGVMLIYNKLKKILDQKGLEEIKTVGEDFNTDFHEAVANIDAEEEMKGKIIDEAEKGYMLCGKVIRFAKVVVGN